MAEGEARESAQVVRAGAAEHEGLGRTFHEKLISLDTMDLRLLLPTAVAIAVVAAGGVLLATRDLVPWPQISAGGLAGEVIGTLPLPVAVLGAITLVVAWSFVLAGALHAHGVLRVAGVSAYAVAGLIAAALSVAGSPPAGLLIGLVVFSVVAAAIGLYVSDRGNQHQAPHLHHRAALRVPTFGWILMATTLIYALMAVSGLQAGTLAEFIEFQLLSLQFLLAPVLVLAGTDFAEWAEVVGGRVSSVLETLPRPALLGGLATAALCVLAWSEWEHSTNPGWMVGAVLPAVVLALPVVATGALSLRLPTSTRVPFWALILGAALLYSGLFFGVIIDYASGAPGPVSPVEMVAASRPAAPSYWLLVPQGWSQTTTQEGRMWSGVVGERPSRLVLLWGPTGTRRALTAALASPVDLRPDRRTHGWRGFSMTSTVAGQQAAGEVWTREAGGRTWVIAGLQAGGTTRASNALWDVVRDSWTRDPAAGVVPSSEKLTPGGYLGSSSIAAVVLLALGLTLLLRGRGEVATGGLFLTLCGLFTAAGPWVVGGVIQILAAGPGAQPVGLTNVVVTAAWAALLVAVLTAVIPRWRLPKPVLRLLLVLLLGLVCLQALYSGVFGAAQTAGARFSVVAGAVLVAALLWDVLMSGESFTNTGGLALPRHTRVLIYLGYTLTVVAAVLFLGSEQVQGGGSAGLEFASETWPALGISGLGPPLLLTFFLVNLAAWRRGGRMGRPDGLDQVDRSMLDEVAG